MTFRAIAAFDMPVVWFWPNPDAGTGEMADTLRHFREHHEAATEKMRFITDVPVDQFIALLKRTACLVGNSSAGIKECSYLGTPVVDVGGRQEGRLRAANVVHAAYDIEAIRAAVAAQLRHGRYPASHIYYRPGVEPDDGRHPGARAALHAEAFSRKRPGERENLMTARPHLTIGTREIGAGRPCFVIAEAGINHNGDVKLWRRSSSMPPRRPAPTRSSFRRIFPSTRCCAAVPRRRTSASRSSTC